MSAATFHWTVATPDGQVAAGDTDFLVVPTVTGELGLMADHAALVACVVRGDLRVGAPGTPATLIGVGGGIVDVRGNTVSLLVERADAPRPA